ncbi:ATP-binding protein [Flavobacterium nackdongense]|uniref:ATP-binding protein n=1 Tax=Flavobacterium nackdongense TaxID=2547394 RepID=A0A4P6YFD0_9FLAO|nr:ATP-binding protein [Flavobacterium nackdongense]QBN19465.1 ATP-binding protein [Flavobacterium nackdongense]
MVSIPRQLAPKIQKDCFKGKVILLLGARQVGKSTLIKMLPFDSEIEVLWLDGENADVHLLLENANSERLKQIAGNHKVVVIDEAQKINTIGSVLKLFSDYHKEIQVIASGSSAFELRNSLNEPLTGRKFEFNLFPISFQEMVNHSNLLLEIRQLPKRLCYGYYPEIVTNSGTEERLLKFLSESYLYKDIFLFKGIKKPEKILELLKLLAWQIGSEVNYNELAKTLKIDNQTIESYVNMLEQAFVIYKLPAFNTNQRKELKKSKKIYFNDLGIRNALINDFRPVEIRNDNGALFENFIINEFRKQNEYQQVFANFYFWRTTDQKEIDLVIKKNGLLHLFEIKWNPNKKAVLTKSFSNIYTNYTFDVINTTNFFEFVSADFLHTLVTNK